MNKSKVLTYYRNLQIRSKITLINTLVISIIAIFIFVFLPMKIRDDGIRNLKHKANSVGQILALNSIAPLQFDDRTSLAETLASVKMDRDIAYVVVRSKNDTPISYYTCNNTNITSFLIEFKNKSIIDTTIPIIKEGSQIGRLTIGLFEDRVKKDIINARLLSVLIAITIIGFGILGNKFLAFQITRPLREVVESVKKLGSPEWKDINLNSEDEIGQLAKAFNFSAGNLKREQELLVRKEELEKTQEKLKAALEVKSAFTSMVSHELRTPLTAIKEGIAIVLDGSAGEINDDQKEFLETAKRNVDRLHRLINDVLDFAKLDSGKIEFHMRENNINDIILGIVKTHKLAAESKGLYLSAEVDMNLPKTIFDADRITQVLTNFVSNAIKFTDAGGVVITSGKGRTPNTIEVRVKDTGPGIKEEDMGKLFKEFSQLGGVKDRKVGGTGLGLAISKQIIGYHKGSVWVESEVGKGSQFCFELPI